MEKESAQTRRIVFLLPCLFTSAGLHFSQLSIDLWKDDMNGIESILAEIVPTSLSGKKDDSHNELQMDQTSEFSFT